MARKSRRSGRKAKGGGPTSSGVFVDEVSSGARPIEGVGTAIAGFVGSAEKGPVPMLRRTGTLLLLVAGAAAAVWGWRHRPALRPFD